MFDYKSLLKKCLLILFIFLSYVLVFLFRQIPAGKLWANYSQVYVPVNGDDSVVMKVFASKNIDGVVSLSNQYLPFSPLLGLKSGVMSNESSAISALSLSALSSSLVSDIDKDSNYLSLRNLFFFDQSKNFRVYYIPENQKKNIPECIAELEEYGIKAGFDAKSAYPWILPLILSLLFVFLAWVCRNKIVFVSCTLPFLFSVYCMPLYPLTLSVSIGMLFVFCASNLWKRNGALKNLLSNYFLMIMIFIAFTAAFACGIRAGLFFTLNSLCSAACAYLIYFIETDFYLRKNVLTFVMIRPARMISVFAEKSRMIMLSLITVQIAILVSFFVNSYVSAASAGSSAGAGKQKIMLPAAKNISAGNSTSKNQNSKKSENNCALPELEDYYEWTWKIASYPYISLNSDYYEGRTAYPSMVEFPEYEESDGKIIRKNSVIRFDDSFKERANNSIDGLSFNAIEKVLKSQEESGDFKPVYTSSESVRISFFSIIMMIFSVLLLLFIYFSVIMKSNSSGGKR